MIPKYFPHFKTMNYFKNQKEKKSKLLYITCTYKVTILKCHPFYNDFKQQLIIENRIQHFRINFSF